MWPLSLQKLFLCSLALNRETAFSPLRVERDERHIIIYIFRKGILRRNQYFPSRRAICFGSLPRIGDTLRVPVVLECFLRCTVAFTVGSRIVVPNNVQTNKRTNTLPFLSTLPYLHPNKQNMQRLTLGLLEDILSPKIEGDSINRVSEEKTLAQLWAGYGNVNSFTCFLSNGEKIPLVVKRVNPPLVSSISHDRKVKSYHIEAAFYTEVSPIIESVGMESNVTCAIPYPYLIEGNNETERDDGPPNPCFQFLLSDLRSQFPDEYGSINECRTRTALRWLASFHAIFWEHETVISNQTKEAAETNLTSSKLWDHGGYWHLDTRLEEWEDMGSSWLELKNCAFAIDERMKADGQQFKTLVHGDFKSANVLFNAEGTDCGVVDFQYCGTGYGMKDIVMFIVSSTSSKVLQSLGEKGLLEIYYEELILNLREIGRLPEDRINAVTVEVLESQYKLALLDYVRFMAGWGFWGSNSGYAENRTRALLREIAKKGNEASSPQKLSKKEWRSAIYSYFPSLG